MGAFTDEGTKIQNLSNLLKSTSYSDEADENSDEDINSPDWLSADHMITLCLELSSLCFS